MLEAQSSRGDEYSVRSKYDQITTLPSAALVVWSSLEYKNILYSGYNSIIYSFAHPPFFQLLQHVVGLPKFEKFSGSCLLSLEALSHYIDPRSHLAVMKI